MQMANFHPSPPVVDQYVRLFTIRETKAYLRIGTTTLYKLCKEGKLTPIKFGRRCTRFQLSEILALIDAHTPTKGAA